MNPITTATIEIITSCNFKCPHCYLDDKSTPGLDIDIWKKVINNLIVKGCRKIVITGGEPLLYKDFNSLYTFIHEQGLEIMLFTNASLINESHFELFRHSPPESVSVSIYGKDNDEYKRYTKNKKITLDRVLLNIEKLEKLGIAVYKGLTLCKSIPVSSLDSYFFTDNDIEINTYLIPSLRSHNNLKERLDPDNVVNIENILSKKRNVKFDKMSVDSQDYYKKCSGGHSSIFIDQFGYASVCAIYRKDKYSVLHDHIDDVWLNLNLVSDKLHKRYFDSQCGECGFNTACRNCSAYMDLEYEVDKNSYLCELNYSRVKLGAT